MSPTPSPPTSSALGDSSAAGGGGGGSSKTRQKRITAPSNTACDACRRRKTRCQSKSTSDACQYCQSAGLQCSFSPDAPVVDRRDYVNNLERRIEHAQHLLEKLSVETGVDLVSLANEAGQDDKFDQARLDDAVNQWKHVNMAAALEQQGLNDYNKAKQSPAPAPPSSLATSSSSKQPDATDSAGLRSPLDRRDQQYVYGRARFGGPSSNPTFVTQVIADFNLSDKMTVGQGKESYVDQTLAESEFATKVFRHPLPPLDLIHALLDPYFAKVNAAWPVLHRASFERHLGQGLASNDPSFRSLLFLVLASAARYSGDSRLHGTFSPDAFYIASCIDAAPHVTRPATIFYLQASVLGITYMLGSEQSTRAWLATGVALRHFVDVGAHVESSPTWRVSPLVDQLRKRSFHALLCLDRSMSMGIGRPITLMSCDYHLDYPLSITDEALDAWDKDPCLGPPPIVEGAAMGFEWNSKLSDIMCDACTGLFPSRTLTSAETFSAANKIRKKAIAWEQELPLCLRWTENPDGVDDAMLVLRAQLRGSSYSVKILTIRTLVLHVARTKLDMESLGPCFAVGRVTLTSLTRLFQTMMDRDLLPQGCGWIPLSASYALTIYFSIMRATKLSYPFLKRTCAELHTVLRVLRILAPTTPEARWVYRSALRLLPLCNKWREGEGVDYVKILLKSGPFDGTIFDVLQSNGSPPSHEGRASGDLSVQSASSSAQMPLPPAAASANVDPRILSAAPVANPAQHFAAQDISVDTSNSFTLPQPARSPSEGLSPETLAWLSRAATQAETEGSVLPELTSATSSIVSNDGLSPLSPEPQQQQLQQPVELPFLSAQFLQTGINDLMSLDVDDMPQALFEGTGQFAFSQEDEHPWFTDDYLRDFFNSAQQQQPPHKFG
ncbi:hypothetical protein ACM66B_005931 [Microbotryomycetes sp. NB124-2]